jgi:hypothetical protein
MEVTDQDHYQMASTYIICVDTPRMCSASISITQSQNQRWYGLNSDTGGGMNRAVMYLRRQYRDSTCG